MLRLARAAARSSTAIRSTGGDGSNGGSDPRLSGPTPPPAPPPVICIGAPLMENALIALIGPSRSRVWGISKVRSTRTAPDDAGRLGFAGQWDTMFRRGVGWRRARVVIKKDYRRLGDPRSGVPLDNR